MPETTGAFKAYLEEMARNDGKIPGKSKKEGKLVVDLDELAREENVVSDSFSEDASEDAAI